jgi:hypothetical protein
LNELSLVPGSEKLLELCGFLRAEGYLSTQRIPSQRRPLWKLAAELQVLGDYRAGTTHCFSSSALPGSYMKSFLRGRPKLETLYRLFFLNQTVPLSIASNALPALLMNHLSADGVLDVTDGVKSRFRLVPWRDSLLLSDPDEGPERQREHYVYVGGDSTVLSDFVTRRVGNRSFRRGLDLCAGTSIQAHNLVENCDALVAAEYNPRAVAFSRVNAAINGLENSIHAVESNLWEYVEGTFDIIVSNPPYLPMPDEKLSTSNLDVCGGTDYGMNIPVEIFRGMARFLNTDGYGVFLAASPVIGGRSLLHERLAPLASELGLSAVMNAWNYTDLILDREYQRRENISYFVFHIIEVTRECPGRIRTVHLPWIHRSALILNASFRKFMP